MDVLDFARQRIIELRNEKGVSARDMSLSMGQNHAYVNKIESGVHKASLEAIEYICKYFGITLCEFFDETNKNPAEITELVSEAKRLDRESLLHLIEIAKRMDKK